MEPVGDLLTDLNCLLKSAFEAFVRLLKYANYLKNLRFESDYRLHLANTCYVKWSEVSGECFKIIQTYMRGIEEAIIKDVLTRVSSASKDQALRAIKHSINQSTDGNLENEKSVVLDNNDQVTEPSREEESILVKVADETLSKYPDRMSCAKFLAELTALQETYNRIVPANYYYTPVEKSDDDGCCYPLLAIASLFMAVFCAYMG